MVYYASEEKQEKLREAISLGFIVVTQGSDGIPTYKLTLKGVGQWIYELKLKE